MSKQPFEEEDSPQKSGLKISNNKSMFQTQKKPSKEESAQKANQLNEQANSYSKRASDLAGKFTKMLNDKTLTENKNLFIQDIEKEILSELLKLGVEINLDESQQEGMGSMGLISLLFKSVISQRDKINNLEYKLEKISFEIDKKSSSE